MQLEEKVVGDVVIVTVTGDIKLGSGDVGLRDKVRSLIEQGHKKLLLDLGGVSYMDSSGLGELVHVYATMKNKGGVLKLVRTDPADQRSTDDHQAGHRVRDLRHGSQRAREFFIGGLAASASITRMRVRYAEGLALGIFLAVCAPLSAGQQPDGVA